MKPKTWYQSANVAIEGVLYAARTQKHMRWHFISAGIVVLTGLFFDLERMEFIALTLAVVLVLVTEILNTAIEAAVDLISEAFHPLAKIAKDTAAGAVFVASFGALVLAFLILYPHVAYSITNGFDRVKLAGDNVAFMATLIVIIAVIILKAYLGQGTPLSGGMPSGHAAFSFSILMAVVFLSESVLVWIFVFVMALMVSHSRVAMGIHTRREVVVGALLGGLVTMLIFLVFG